MSCFVVFQEKGITETNGSVFSAVFVTDFLGENDARDGDEKRRHPAYQRKFVGPSMKMINNWFNEADQRKFVGASVKTTSKWSWSAQVCRFVYGNDK